MDDDSLQYGDAVMTPAGIRIFVGGSSDHHRPEDSRKFQKSRNFRSVNARLSPRWTHKERTRVDKPLASSAWSRDVPQRLEKPLLIPMAGRSASSGRKAVLPLERQTRLRRIFTLAKNCDFRADLARQRMS